MSKASLRKGYTHKLVEDACRMIVLYCLNAYRGDEKIKQFIWDLITPQEFGGSQRVSKNHSGLSGPVPRGRKGKKGKGSGYRDGGNSVPKNVAWVSDEKYDLDVYLDKMYRKHLERHGTKLLLRIRMLYYIQHDILADYMKEIGTPGIPARLETHYLTSLCLCISGKLYIAHLKPQNHMFLFPKRSVLLKKVL